jgi:putative exporter of polyketide antibiotics
MPGADFTATPMVTLTMLAALLIAAVPAGFRRRDIG